MCVNIMYQNKKVKPILLQSSFLCVTTTFFALFFYLELSFLDCHHQLMVFHRFNSSNKNDNNNNKIIII